MSSSLSRAAADLEIPPMRMSAVRPFRGCGRYVKNRQDDHVGNVFRLNALGFLS